VLIDKDGNEVPPKIYQIIRRLGRKFLEKFARSLPKFRKLGE